MIKSLLTLHVKTDLMLSQPSFLSHHTADTDSKGRLKQMSVNDTSSNLHGHLLNHQIVVAVQIYRVHQDTYNSILHFLVIVLFTLVHSVFGTSTTTTITWHIFVFQSKLIAAQLQLWRATKWMQLHSYYWQRSILPNDTFRNCLQNHIHFSQTLPWMMHIHSWL